MDRYVIIKKKGRSDAEASAHAPSTSGSTEIPTTSLSSVTQKTGRRYRHAWEKTYTWLSYDTTTEKAYCDFCRLAVKERNVPPPKTSPDKDSYEAFVQKGFSNWKKALYRFRSHQSSNLHRMAVVALACVKVGVNVRATISSQQMQDARMALLRILSSVRYLACQGQALRGHEKEDSNLKQLLLIGAEDIPQLKSWLDRTKYKWISPHIVNEMLEIMAHNVLRTLVEKIKSAVYYSVIIDETTDNTTQEQFSFCFRIATEDMSTEELFFGFYEGEKSTTAQTLFSILKDVLCRFNLSLNQCRGQCYDVGGHLSGVQALVKAEEPRALYVHRFAHVPEKVMMCKHDHFPSDVSQHMCKIEKFAMGEDDSAYILNFYGNDFHATQLELHRDMFLDIAKQRKVKLLGLRDVIDLFTGKEGKALQVLLPEFAKLVKISLTIPVYSCTSERSFSCLHRVKTFLQSNMGQARLNHVAILHGHRQIATKIDLNVIANEFIKRKSIRRNAFTVI